MKRWKVISIVVVVLLAAVVAAAFAFPEYANPQLSRVPGAPQVPNIPYKLGLDLQGGVHLVYQADLSRVDSANYDSAMGGLRDVIERRVNFFGVSEPLVQTEGDGGERRLIVQLAGIFDTHQAIQLIGDPPLLDFREPKPNYSEIIESNTLVFETGEGEFEDPFVITYLNGSLLDRADVGFNNITQEPLITLQFNSEGAQLFEEITARNIGQPLAIYLDGAPLQTPIVQTAISGGRAQITGDFELQEVQRIVRELNAGAIPVGIDLIFQETVGPTLGQISLEQSLRAALLGLTLVTVFMIAFYRIPGLLAALALLIYIVLMLSLFKLIGVTLTLAGIAGLILSIGMAVDANILIFSRMREELKEGKTFATAIEEGFRRAWPSIRDGNITTILVAVILFGFGSSFVQGFALALSVGILLSMFSAIFVTKNFLRLFALLK
jgi:preprotein translocase subunit SecD